MTTELDTIGMTKEEIAALVEKEIFENGDPEAIEDNIDEKDRLTRLRFMDFAEAEIVQRFARTYRDEFSYVQVLNQWFCRDIDEWFACGTYDLILHITVFLQELSVAVPRCERRRLLSAATIHAVADLARFSPAFYSKFNGEVTESRVIQYLNARTRTERDRQKQKAGAG